MKTQKEAGIGPFVIMAIIELIFGSSFGWPAFWPSPIYQGSFFLDGLLLDIEKSSWTGPVMVDPHGQDNGVVGVVEQGFDTNGKSNGTGTSDIIKVEQWALMICSL